MVRLCGIALVAALMMGTPGWTAASSELRIGIVDLQRVASEAPMMKQYSAELVALSNSLDAKMRLRDQYVMLGEGEIRELIDLKAKPNPTAADEARVKALIDTERSRDAELKKLQQTKDKDLSAQDRARLKELQGSQLKSREARETAAKDCDSQMQSKSQDLWNQAESEIQTAVAKIAEAKKLPFVVAKGITLADGAVAKSVLYGGVDITDDVIGKLPRKAQ